MYKAKSSLAWNKCRTYALLYMWSTGAEPLGSRGLVSVFHLAFFMFMTPFHV